MKEYLIAMRSTEEFQNVLELIRKEAPQVPGHTVSPDNTEEWKAQSHERDGFFYCLSFI